MEWLESCGWPCRFHAEGVPASSLELLAGQSWRRKSRDALNKRILPEVGNEARRTVGFGW